MITEGANQHSFKKNSLLTYEDYLINLNNHSLTRDYKAVDLASLILYYTNSGSHLIHGDTLNIGDTASESQHHLTWTSDANKNITIDKISSYFIQNKVDDSRYDYTYRKFGAGYKIKFNLVISHSQHYQCGQCQAKHYQAAKHAV